MMEQTSTTGSVESTVFEKKAFASQSRQWNRTSNPRFVETFPELAAEPAEFPSASKDPPKSAVDSSQTLAIENPKGVSNLRGEIANRLHDTADLLQADGIGDDLRSIIPSNTIMFGLLVVIISFLLYRWI